MACMRMEAGTRATNSTPRPRDELLITRGARSRKRRSDATGVSREWGHGKWSAAEHRVTQHGALWSIAQPVVRPMRSSCEATQARSEDEQLAVFAHNMIHVSCVDVGCVCKCVRTVWRTVLCVHGMCGSCHVVRDNTLRFPCRFLSKIFENIMF